MRRGRHYMGIAVLAVAGLMAVGVGASRDTHAQAEMSMDRSPKGDVVMMRCNVLTSDFPVTAYQGSPGTPGRQSAVCAENVAALMKAGFVIRDIGHYDMQTTGFVVYTLIR